MSSNSLKLVSYLAPNMFWFYEAIASSLSQALGKKAHIIQSQYDPLEDPDLLHNQLDIAFICGLPFIRYHQIVPNQLQAIAAPVMQHSRYQNRPIYFSDIIVKADSSLRDFNDLKSTILCYNDLGSNSGYNLLRHRLIQSSYPPIFFSKVIQSYSHQRSIQLVIEGVAQCSAIDSTVLEQELLTSPELSHQIRIIESLGSCPIPPIVVANHLGTEVINKIQSAILYPDIGLKLAMDQAQTQRYEPVNSEDYVLIGKMYDEAIALGYQIGA